MLIPVSGLRGGRLAFLCSLGVIVKICLLSFSRSTKRFVILMFVTTY